ADSHPYLPGRRSQADRPRARPELRRAAAAAAPQRLLRRRRGRRPLPHAPPAALEIRAEPPDTSPTHIRPASASGRPYTRPSNEPGWTRATTSGSRFALSKYEANPSHSVNQPFGALYIDLASKPCHLHVNDVVERRRAARLLPNLPRQHFA